MNTAIVGLFSMAMGVFFIIIAWYVLTLVARWRVFTKAGLAGWKSLIPLYSEYCTFKISWKTTFFWLVLAAGLVSGILTGMIGNGENVPEIVSMLASISGMAVTVINLVMNVKLSQKFGHGVLFGLGLMFLSPLFTMILGLGESEYLGNPEEGIIPPGKVFYV